MPFPLYILTIPYFIFLAVWSFLSLVGFYHLLRFGRQITGLILIALYLAGALGLLSLSYQFLSPIDWQMRVSVFSGGSAPASLDLGF